MIERPIQAAIVHVCRNVIVYFATDTGKAPMGDDGIPALTARVAAIAIAAQQDIRGPPGLVGVHDKIADSGLVVRAAIGTRAIVIGIDPLCGHDGGANPSRLLGISQCLEVVGAWRALQRLTGDDHIIVRWIWVQESSLPLSQLVGARIALHRLWIVHHLPDLFPILRPVARIAPEHSIWFLWSWLGIHLYRHILIVEQLPFLGDVLHRIKGEHQDLVPSLLLHRDLRSQHAWEGP